MITDPLFLRVDLIETLKQLSTALNEFSSELSSLPSSFPAWVLGADESVIARQLAGSCFRSIEYVDGQEGNESQTLAGALAVTPDLIEKAGQVNQLKLHLRSVIKSMGRLKTTVVDPFTGEKVEELLVSATLKKSGFPQLHKQQAYRLIPIVPVLPESISFCWARTRKVSRLSRDKAVQYLNKSSFAGLEEIELVRAMPESIHLALVDEPRVHVRTNLTYFVVPEALQSRCKKQLQSSMPLIYPLEWSQVQPKLPRLSKLTPEPSEDPMRMGRRSDKLEDEPLFPGMGLFRYRE